MFRRNDVSGSSRQQKRALRAATREYKKRTRLIDTNTEVINGLLKSRQEQIQRTLIGRTSQGVLCFAYTSGYDALDHFLFHVGNDAVGESEMTRTLLELPFAKWHLKGLERALRVPAWAYWRSFTTVYGEEDYWVAQGKAFEALTPLTEPEAEIAELGPVDENEDQSEYFVVLLARMYGAAFGGWPDVDERLKLLPYWESAWSAGWTGFRERFERFFPELEWPSLLALPDAGSAAQSDNP